MTARPLHERVKLVVTLLFAVAGFLFAWLFRFNDPSGSFAGLTDDHFFYLVRGWQILFGDLPVRDFVDHGAPLYYYAGAAVQTLFGRGTVSELAFSVTMLSLSAALTFCLATRASGSIVAGLAAFAFHVLLEPRFYNYPKLLVYAVALPLLWRYANAPSVARLAWVAVVTVVGFLFRHDHGLFVGVATAALIVALDRVPWTTRLRHAAAYAGLCLVLVAPYLVFIERYAGLATYFRQASEWAERDRDRAPVVWPGLFENPDGVSDAAQQAAGVGLGRAIAVVRDNAVAWSFYAEILLPLFALALLLTAVDAYRPRWTQARAKIFSVAVLAVVLDIGFLRSPLEARLADPSVPLAILVAWLLVAVPQLLFSARSLRPQLRNAIWPVRVAAGGVALLLAAVFGATLSNGLYDRLDKANLVERPGNAIARAGAIADQLTREWQLESWRDRPDRSPLIDLAFYLNACTAPTDRVLVQAYIPEVLALARRAFAGGHADLRPGFFGTEEAQRLTIARLQAQSVPVVLLEAGDSYRNFRDGFPLVTAYLDRNYHVAGTHEFERWGTTLLVKNDRVSTATYEPLGWPCYGTGRIAS